MDSATDDWAAGFFRDVDTKDIEKLAAWFAENIELRFGNAPAVHGKESAVGALRQFWTTFASLRHHRESVVANGDSASQQSIVTYTLLDGRDVALPVASYLRRTAAGTLDRLWIYADMAPFYAAAQANS